MTVAGTVLAPFLAGRAAAWVETQRARHRPRAERLPIEAAERLAGWFLPESLAAVRLRAVPRIDPPAPLGLLERLGVRLPLEFERIWGITFVDTIVLLERVPEEERGPLLFHECVHVVQYRLLGTRGFLERYVRGWLAVGRRYRDIPLEMDAYALARRFVEEPGAPFAVEPEVARRLAGPEPGGPRPRA